MEKEELYRCVDHTALKAYTAWEEIEKLCEEAVSRRTASVCIPSCYVKRVNETYGKQLTVCTVIGFPLGYANTEAKIAETRAALSDGADEIDMVINLCEVKNGNYKQVEDEIRLIKAETGEKILKVIIETCYLTKKEKIAMCRAVTNAGADYIKTSTGFGTAGAVLEDVQLMKEHIGSEVKIKAAGGIRSKEDMEAYIDAGCERLGTSSAIEILEHAGDRDKTLIQEARKAQHFSYAPYSNFHVGAALLGKSGTIYRGCNIENAAYSPTNCAERTAVCKAVSEGEMEFEAIAIAGDGETYLSPCGVCRQVLAEFVDPEEFQIIMVGKEDAYRKMTLAEIFPSSFTKNNLKNTKN